MHAAVAYCSVPNITHMWSAYASRDRFHIIMEYCQGGNMLDWLKAQQPHTVPEQWLAMQVGSCAGGVGWSRKGSARCHVLWQRQSSRQLACCSVCRQYEST
jgi:serine/threonine protein kinase